jgi:hypothetical protein
MLIQFLHSLSIISVIFLTLQTGITPVTANTPEPIFYFPEYKDPPFAGTAVPGVGIRGWLRNSNGTRYVGFSAGRGGMGAVSTHRFWPYQAVCARMTLPSPTYGNYQLLQVFFTIFIINL